MDDYIETRNENMPILSKRLRREGGKMEKTVFPVQSDVSFIPPDFWCSGFDLRNPEFAVLVEAGCICFTEVECPAGWKILRRGDSEPDHIDLFFIRSGSFILETARRTFRAGPQQLLLVPSWIDRCILQESASSHIYFRYENPRSYPTVREVSVSNSPGVEPINFYAQMLLHNNRTLPGEVMYRSGLAELIHILIQRELHQENKWGTSVEHVDRFLQMLRSSSRKNFDAEKIAREFGMSFSGFRKFCYENFSKPPRAVVEEVRMDRARGMLDYSNLGIDEIAESLGYADRYTFTKAFTRVCGMPPIRFRNRYAQKHG